MSFGRWSRPFVRVFVPLGYLGFEVSAHHFGNGFSFEPVHFHFVSQCLVAGYFGLKRLHFFWRQVTGQPGIYFF